MANRARSRAVGPLVALLLAAGPAAADWLVYLGGGIQETRGGWEVRGGTVQFHAPNGTLLSVRAGEVDLAASAFISWQLGERRAIRTDHPPAGAELRAATGAGAPAGSPAGDLPCVPAQVTRVLSAETLELAGPKAPRTVHLACIDAPETEHRYPELARFGQHAASAVQLMLLPRGEVCVVEERPPLVDRLGHHVVYVRLLSGRDLGEEVLSRGLALARSGDCARRARYVEVERQALVGEAGHWGTSGYDLSEVVLAHVTTLAGVPAGGGAGRAVG